MLRSLISSAAALAALAIGSRDATACVTCACGDPTITVMGSEKPFAGRLRLSAELRRRAETIDGVDIADHRLVLGAAYAPASWFVIAGELPLVWRDAGGSDAVGPGDAAVRGKLFVFHSGDDTARHLIAITAGVKAPTALRRAADQPVAFEPGTGSVDPELGLSYGFFAYPWSAQASIAALRPIGGWDDSRPAAAARASASVQYQPSWVLAFGLGIDARIEGEARNATTDPIPLAAVRALRPPAPHDGEDHGSDGSTGALVMLSPTASTQVATDLHVTATIRVPVWRDLAAGHDEGLSLSLALVKDL